MCPDATCVHRTSGRFRLRIPAAKGDLPFFATVQEELSRCPGVTAVRANPVTATLLIFHNNNLSAVADYAREKGLFTLGARGEAPGRADLAGTTIAAYKKVNAQVKRLSGGELDLAQGIFATLLVTGLYQLARGKLSAPPWHTAFWYALSIFLKSQEKEGEGV